MTVSVSKSLSARSLLIAGMAAVGAGAIAVAPVQPISQDLAALPQQVNSLAVGLAASIDPITPWINTLQLAGENIVELFDFWASDPFPIIQQVVGNQFTYLSELPDIGLILNQVVGNIGNAIRAPFAADPENTLNDEHDSIWTLLPVLVDIPENLQPILDFTTTFLSGALIGVAGPVLAPLVQLGDSLSSIVGNLVGGDLVAALNDLINIPANVVNAVLNGGQVLDLTPLVNLLGIEIPGTQINSIGFALGGLLSQGGSLFNAFDTNLIITEYDVEVPLAGVGAGALGSVIGLTQTIANAIAVTPPAAASARSAAAVEAPAEAAAPAAVAATADVAETAAVAPTAEVAVTAADVADVVATGDVATADTATGDNDNSGSTRSGRDKVSRSAGDGASSTGQDAPKRSGKAGASRAG
ncbi:MAG TPA: outer membrane porin GjpA [Mycobacterium sp.]|nr:outer membrane porin GjpA [Mycobacterium sp.]HPZ96346.1 outer membrane porin GjpA [Mycobacterium sp.]HQE16063.1 outer membrane porin GjpA [Mycobacterium sp.]